MDTIFQWTGRGMGWDIYGTGPGFEHGDCEDQVDNETGVAATSGDFIPGDGFADAGIAGQPSWEWCDDHGTPLPVEMPSLLDMSFGGFWSGSPFLGHLAALPPGEGGLNPLGGYVFPWHSHHELEVVNFDVFPGGMFTGFVVVPPEIP